MCGVSFWSFSFQNRSTPQSYRNIITFVYVLTYLHTKLQLAFNSIQFFYFTFIEFRKVCKMSCFCAHFLKCKDLARVIWALYDSHSSLHTITACMNHDLKQWKKRTLPLSSSESHVRHCHFHHLHSNTHAAISVNLNQVISGKNHCYNIIAILASCNYVDFHFQEFHLFPTRKF